MDEGKKKLKIGLALSGGGYRAAAFHLGVFRKLRNLQFLDKIDVISTVSGGSIAGAYYALNKDNFESFEKNFISSLQKSIIKRIVWHWRFWLPILILAVFIWFIFYNPFNLYFPSWLIGIFIVTIFLLILFKQFKIISFTSLKINAYKKVFFGNKIISDLPEFPTLAINATNLSTGTLWTFSKNKSSDSSYEYPKDGSNSIKFKCGSMPIAVAVASSSSVPVPFDPVTIPINYYTNKLDFKRINPQLIDGGLYDNQGIHKITQANSSYACDIIIVSDGSQPFTNSYKSSSTFYILYRGIDVMMRKIKNLQFIRDVYSAKKEIAYFSLDWKYELCLIEFIKAAKNNLVPQSVLLYHGLSETLLQQPLKELQSFISTKIGFDKIIENALTDGEIKIISCIKTNLTALKAKEINLLSRHGETLADIQIKLYCPTIITQH